MVKRIIISLLLMGIGFNANSITLDHCVAIIIRNDKALLDTAVSSLVHENNIKTYAFISAIIDKRLYTKDEKAYSQYPGLEGYYEIFPQQNVPVGNLSGMEEVEISRKLRFAFNDISRYVNLVHTNRDIRQMAFQAFKVTGSVDDVPLILDLAKEEKEKDIQITAYETVYSLWLGSGNMALETKALDSLDKVSSFQMLETIDGYLRKSSNKESKNYERAALIKKHIERRQKRINTYQNLFSGISLGSILLLVALGLAIIYGLGGVINMSHGEFMMIGAYTTFSIQQFFINHLPAEWFGAFFWVSLPMSFIIAGIFGLLIERLIIRYLYSRPLESLLGTWGVSLILIQLCRTIYGDVTAVKAPEILSGGIEITTGLILPFNRLFIIGLTIVMVVLTYLLFAKSRLGLKIRSVTQNRNMSASLGISTKRVDASTFFLGSGLAGIAGCAMTLIGNVVPNMGQTYIVDSFLIVVVGGVGKLAGTIVSAMGIGILSKIFEFFFQAVYGKVIMLVIIIFFLQYKPKGLFPDKGRIGDD